MNNESGAEPEEADRRPLALLVFALCLLGLAGLRELGFTSQQQAQTPARHFLWADGPSGPGLYRVPPDGSLPAGLRPQTWPARLAPLFFQPIPINQADEELLATIPGIGPAFARRIIDFREQQGRINAIAELDAVKGVGPAKLKILQEYLLAD